MIIDTVAHLKKHTSIPHVDAIAAFLDSTDVSALSEGDMPIQGEDLYVKVLRYVPKKSEENNFEMHNVYTDVQVMVYGAEIMQTAPLDCLHKKTDCDSEGDFHFFSADKYISNIVVQKGQFIVFFPGEAHKPGCRYQDSEAVVMKLVLKTKGRNS